MGEIDLARMTLPAAPQVPGLGMRDIPLDATLDLDAIGRPLPEPPSLFGKATPPPALDSELASAEREFISRFNRTVTAQSSEATAWLAHEGTWGMWADLAREHRGRVGFVKGWSDTARMGAAMVVARGRAEISKRGFDRMRPFQLDDTIKVLGKIPRASDHSYPSGHATMAAAAATVLERADPANASLYRRAARLTLLSRMHAGVHFPSDTAMGLAIGRQTGSWFSKGLRGAAQAVAVAR